MTLDVDEEAVVAEAALGRPRLELREVDRAGRELLEDREQRTRAVLALEADDRRLVVTGRRGDARARRARSGSGSRGGPRSRSRARRGRTARPRARCRSRPGRSASTSRPRTPPRQSSTTRACRPRAASWRASRGTARAHAGTTRRSARRPSATPGWAHRLSDTGRSISRWISSSLSKASVSSVTDTEPSIMFSIGTRPASNSPRSTAAITSGTDRCGGALRTPRGRPASAAPPR